MGLREKEGERETKHLNKNLQLRTQPKSINKIAFDAQTVNGGDEAPANTIKTHKFVLQLQSVEVDTDNALTDSRSLSLSICLLDSHSM